MKIYIVREHSGEWEDYFCENLMGFFSEDEAEKYKEELEQKEKQKKLKAFQCVNCPMSDYDKSQKIKDFEELKKCLKDYCGRFE